MKKHWIVLGGGSWGTALACQIAKKQAYVDLVMRDAEIADEIRCHHTNKKYLGEIKLPENIRATTDWTRLKEAGTIVLALPSYAFFQALSVLKLLGIDEDVNLVVTTKGLSKNPVELISSRLERSLPNKIAFLAGPNFAKEVASGSISAATVASKDLGLAKELASYISSENFVTSSGDDIITIQVAGIVKNIIAIQSGINEARNYGENARAMLVAEGAKEIFTIAKALGGKVDSLVEYGVIGDLVLTCYSKTSRNTRFGYELAGQTNPSLFVQNYPTLVEGKESARLILELTKPYNLDLPIIRSVVELLGNG